MRGVVGRRAVPYVTPEIVGVVVRGVKDDFSLRKGYAGAPTRHLTALSMRSVLDYFTGKGKGRP